MHYWVCVWVSLSTTDLIQDLSVTGEELGQVFDELLDALQSSLLHDGSGFLGDGLWDGVSGEILQSSWEVQGCQHPDAQLHITCQFQTSLQVSNHDDKNLNMTPEWCLLCCILIRQNTLILVLSFFWVKPLCPWDQLRSWHLLMDILMLPGNRLRYDKGTQA